MKPAASVLVLTYNHEAYLDGALEGLRRQRTNFSCEVVVADDCSQDETPAIARRWANRFAGPCRLLSRPKNLGVAANFVERPGGMPRAARRHPRRRRLLDRRKETAKAAGFPRRPTRSLRLLSLRPAAAGRRANARLGAAGGREALVGVHGRARAELRPQLFDAHVQQRTPARIAGVARRASLLRLDAARLQRGAGQARLPQRSDVRLPRPRRRKLARQADERAGRRSRADARLPRSPLRGAIRTAHPRRTSKFGNND